MKQAELDAAVKVVRDVLVALGVMVSPALAQEAPRSFDTAPQNQPILAWVQEGQKTDGSPTGFWSSIIWKGGNSWTEGSGTTWAGALPLYWLPLPAAPVGYSREELEEEQ